MISEDNRPLQHLVSTFFPLERSGLWGQLLGSRDARLWACLLLTSPSRRKGHLIKDPGECRPPAGRGHREGTGSAGQLGGEISASLEDFGPRSLPGLLDKGSGNQISSAGRDAENFFRPALEAASAGPAAGEGGMGGNKA